MPEVYFKVRWPDESEEECYSPSSVIENYFQPNHTYTLQDFGARSEEGLLAASDRVKASYGFACSRAQAQLTHIRSRISQFSNQQDATVTCLSMSR